MGARALVAATAAAAATAPLHHRAAAAGISAVSVSFCVPNPPRRQPPFHFPSIRRMNSGVSSSNKDDGGGGGDGRGGESIKQRKAGLRKEVAARLKALDDAYIQEQVNTVRGPWI